MRDHTMPATPSSLTRRRCLQQLTALCVSTTCTMTTSAATPIATTPAEVASALSKAQLLGRATLRFFGLRVYEARLWVPPAFDALRYDSLPFALELAYARKLNGSDIAERSIAEMRRVGDFSEAQSKAWQDMMNKAFPDVQADDRLTGVHDGQGLVRFYFNGQATASIKDKDYARLFFGIWLSDKTSAPGLRASLIGQG